jgi:transposase
MKNNTLTCYVGVDVSKEKLDIYVYPHNHYEQIDNEKTAIRKLVLRLIKTYQTVHIACEASGGYERTLTQVVHALEVPISVLNARCVRDLAKAMGKLAKTDKVDAKMIALFCERLSPRTTTPMSDTEQVLREYRKRRDQLVDMITMEKNRLHQAGDRGIEKSIEKHIKTLEKELAEVDEALDKLIKQDPDSQKKVELLMSCKGVGRCVASTLLVYLPELGQIKRGAIASLVGVAPLNRDSGKTKGERQTWGGRAVVRCKLYMATLVAVKHNAPIKACYERLLQAGKRKKVALVACMRKLLLTLNSMLKNGTTWTPVFEQKN